MAQTSSNDAASEKAALRKLVLEQRQAMSAGEVTHRTNRIFENFKTNLDTILPETYSVVGLYFPIRGEVDTRSFFTYFKKLKKVCAFPRVEDKHIAFYPIQDWSELRLGKFGVAEPQPSPDIKPVLPNLLLVPGVVFSETAHRLGYGGGYYDRWLESADKSASCTRGEPRMITVGLAYTYQMYPHLPQESQDRPLDMVLTEEKLIKR